MSISVVILYVLAADFSFGDASLSRISPHVNIFGVRVNRLPSNTDKLGYSGFRNLFELRGGDANIEEVDTMSVQESLYHPGLLTAKVRGKNVAATVKSDSSITVSRFKAKELGLEPGDFVGLVGRRRRVTYAVIEVNAKKSPKNECSVSNNVASMIRIREGDTIKIVPLGRSNETIVYETGEMQLLSIQSERPKRVSSITIAPISDSILALEKSETGGDEIDDNEIISRFISPYFESGGIVKAGTTLHLVDENGKKLDVQVIQVELEGETKEKKENSENNDDGKFMRFIFKGIKKLI